MPDREQILNGLTEAANVGYWLAVAWHVVGACCMVTLASGWRPSNRVAAGLLSAPLASVALTAFWMGNRFNGIVFTVLAVALVALANVFGDRETAFVHSRASMVAGGVLVAFGWTYPHFLVGRSPVHYLFAAPMGVIPCPTLAVVCGVAVMARGFGNRAWSWTLAGVATFYAIFGAIRLGVIIDVALFAGAIALFTATISRRTASPISPSVSAHPGRS